METICLLENYMSDLLLDNRKEVLPNINKLNIKNNLPLKVKYEDGLGRYLVAASDIRAGEVIFSEPALILTPKPGDGLITCTACFLPLPDKDWPVCEVCQVPKCFPLCSGTWHSKEECLFVSKLTIDKHTDVKLLNVLLSPIRAIVKMLSSDSARDIIVSLQSNTDKRKNLNISLFLDSYVVPYIVQLVPKEDIATLVHHICGVFDTNAFEVAISEKQIARAIFPLASLMNNSCSPNTQHWFYNGKCVVRAMVDIPAKAPITNSYSSVIWGTKLRTQHLLYTKLFLCKCPRCQDPTELGSYMSSIVCLKCHQNKLTPCFDQRGWQCLNEDCKLCIPRAIVDAILKRCVSRIQKIKEKSSKELGKAISEMLPFLGDSNYLIVELKYTYVSAVMSLPSIGHLLVNNIEAYLQLLKKRGMQESDIQELKELKEKVEECEYILLYDLKLPEVKRQKKEIDYLLRSRGLA